MLKCSSCAGPAVHPAHCAWLVSLALEVKLAQLGIIHREHARNRSLAAADLECHGFCRDRPVRLKLVGKEYAGRLTIELEVELRRASIAVAHKGCDLALAHGGGLTKEQMNVLLVEVIGGA